MLFIVTVYKKGFLCIDDASNQTPVLPPHLVLVFLLFNETENFTRMKVIQKIVINRLSHNHTHSPKS